MFGLNIFKKTDVKSQPMLQAVPSSLGLAYGHVQVLPCVINKQPFVIYPKGLKQTSPELFSKLSQYYTAKGYGLKKQLSSHLYSFTLQHLTNLPLTSRNFCASLHASLFS